jgi:predicted alpha/beta hydrolase family esterase
MQQVFYIHGGNAYSNYADYLNELKTMIIPTLLGEVSFKKWSETLRDGLGEEYEVFMPSMPNSKNAKYQEWKIWFERHFEFLHNDIILVGWSQGGYFLSKYLIEEKLPFTVKALILVAAVFEPADFGGEDGGDFAFDTTRTGELENVARNIVIMHSTDDFVVPYEHALKYKEALPHAELVTFEDKNHFLISEFPELIAKIKSF